MEGPPLEYGPATHDDAAQVLAGADGSTEAATSRAGRAAAPPGTAQGTASAKAPSWRSCSSYPAWRG